MLSQFYKAGLLFCSEKLCPKNIFLSSTSNTFSLVSDISGELFLLRGTEQKVQKAKLRLNVIKFIYQKPKTLDILIHVWMIGSHVEKCKIRSMPPTNIRVNSSSSSFFFFFFFCLFFGPQRSIWKFPGQGLNQSYSCWPIPPPQQRVTWAMSAPQFTAMPDT